MPESQSDPLIQRLDRLERENWYWKRATLSLLIVIASAILMGQTVKPSRIVAGTMVAESFVLKDSNGNTRGELGKGIGDDYGLRLYSSGGRYLVRLVDQPATEAVFLELNDHISASTAHLSVSNDTVSLELISDEQTKEARERNMNAYSRQFNAAKTPQERQSVLSNHPPHGVRATVIAFPKGTSSMGLTNGYGPFDSRSAIEMNLSKDGQPTLHLDKNGKVIWRAP